MRGGEDDHREDEPHGGANAPPLVTCSRANRNAKRHYGKYVAKLADRDAIREQEYNLSVSMYVEKEDMSEKIDINALECQGVQHFYPYGSKDTDFQARQQRDKEKYEERAAHGIRVFYYVNPDIPVPDNLDAKYHYVTDLDELYVLIA